jgi:N-acetylmuramoyl-L-alanine amidase
MRKGFAEFMEPIYGWIEEKLPRALRSLSDALRALRGRQEEGVPSGPPRGVVPPGFNEVPPDWQPPPRVPTDEERSEWYRRRGGRRGPAPVRFGAMGDDLIDAPAPGTRAAWTDLHGGYSTNIEDRREMAQDSKTQTEYLREIRDVLAWMRDQATGGGETSPQGFAGGYAGGGGGGWGAGGGVLGGGGAGAGGGVLSPSGGSGGTQTGGAGGSGTGTNPLTGGGAMRIPRSPAEAPESIEAAVKGGFMRPDGGAGGAATAATGKPDISGRQTWFNPYPYTYRDPKTGEVWTDTEAMRRREGPHASGLPIGTPGFAHPGRKGLGGWYELTLPDGRKVITQKTDIGPKGVIDLNAALAASVYGSRQAAVAAERRGPITGRYLGQNLPEGVTPGLQGDGAGGGRLTTGAIREAIYGPEQAGGQAGAAAQEGIRDISRQARLPTGAAMTPQGLMIHHTSGREKGAEGVADVLRKRGLSVQFVIDREGNISQLTPEGRTAFHAGRLERLGGGRRWGNWNLEGVEVIAKNEADVTDAQRAAIARLTRMRSERWDGTRGQACGATANSPAARSVMKARPRARFVQAKSRCRRRVPAPHKTSR